MKNQYCLDTNFFITLWHNFPPDIFTNFSEIMLELALSKKCYITTDVYEELTEGDNKKEDLLKVYITNNKYIWTKELNEEIEKIFINLMDNKCVSDLVDVPNNKNGADGFILAYAEYYSSIVVTSDKALQQCCKKLNLTYLSPYDFLRENQIKFIAQI